MQNQTNTEDKKSLILPALYKFGFGLIVIGLLIFLCAGDIGYWNAWLI